MKYYYYTLPIFFTVVGCTRSVYTPVVTSHVIIDTVTQQVADSATIRALFECDSAGRVVLRELNETKGRMASHQMSIEDGEVRIVTRWQTKYIDRIREVRDTVTVVETRDVIQSVRYVPKFFWWCFAVAAGSVLWGGFKLLTRLRR